MSKWTADIGSWERGRTVHLGGASNLNEALLTARRLCKADDDVVQVYEDGRIRFDFFNGSAIYQSGAS